MPWRRPHPESLVVGAVLTVLVALGQISTSVYIPSMPSLVTALDTDAERVNLTFSVFLAGFAVSQLVYGPMSDLYGRRRVLLGGLALFFVASLACAAATSIGALIAARFVQAVGACAGPVLGRAIVHDVYGRDRAAKALAYIGVALAISPAITPVIGGYLQVSFGWRASFLFLAVVALGVLSAVWLLLVETSPKPVPMRPRDMARTYVTLLGDPVFVGYAASIAFVFAGLMTYAALGPFVFIDLLGLTPDVFGLLSVFHTVGFLAGTLSAGRLTTPPGPGAHGAHRNAAGGGERCRHERPGPGRGLQRGRDHRADDGVHGRHGHHLSQRHSRRHGAFPGRRRRRLGHARVPADGRGRLGRGPGRGAWP